MRKQSRKPVLRMTPRITVKYKLRFIVTGSSIAAIIAASIMYIYMTQSKESKAKSTQPIEKSIPSYSWN